MSTVCRLSNAGMLDEDSNCADSRGAIKLPGVHFNQCSSTNPPGVRWIHSINQSNQSISQSMHTGPGVALCYAQVLEWPCDTHSARIGYEYKALMLADVHAPCTLQHTCRHGDDALVDLRGTG